MCRIGSFKIPDNLIRTESYFVCLLQCRMARWVNKARLSFAVDTVDLNWIEDALRCLMMLHRKCLVLCDIFCQETESEGN